MNAKTPGRIISQAATGPAVRVGAHPSPAQLGALIREAMQKSLAEFKHLKIAMEPIYKKLPKAINPNFKGFLEIAALDPREMNLWEWIADEYGNRIGPSISSCLLSPGLLKNLDAPGRRIVSRFKKEAVERCCDIIPIVRQLDGILKEHSLRDVSEDQVAHAQFYLTEFMDVLAEIAALQEKKNGMKPRVKPGAITPISSRGAVF